MNELKKIVYIVLIVSFLGQSIQIAALECETLETIPQQVLKTRNSIVSGGEKPRLDLEFIGQTPQEPMVGDEITFTYQLTPQPFQHKEYLEQEVVLVLDTSNSMVNGGIKEVIDAKGEKTYEFDLDKHRMYTALEALKTFLKTMASSEVQNLKVSLVSFDAKGNLEVSHEAINEQFKFPKLEERLDTIALCNEEVYTYANKPSADKTSSKYKQSVACQTYHENKSVSELKAEGYRFLITQTNIGDGMRLAADLLKNKGTDTAKKTLILMTDGAPYGWTYEKGQTKKDYYLKIDDKVALSKQLTKGHPILATGNDEDHADQYAQAMGDLIQQTFCTNENETSQGCKTSTVLGLDVYSIGFDLKSATQKRLTAIHTALKADADHLVLNATPESIKEVYTSIAGQIIDSYNIDSAKLNLNLDQNFKASEGFDLALGDNVVKVDPIIYTLDEDMWYRAKPQQLQFTVKALAEGTFDVFKEGSQFVFKDIFGTDIKINVADLNVTVSVKPYEPEAAQKLSVTLSVDQNGYLIGDKVNVPTVINRRESDVLHQKFSFNFLDLPAFLTFASDNEKTSLSYEQVTSSQLSHSFSFMVSDHESVTVNQPLTRYLNGTYAYTIVKDEIQKEIEESIQTPINVKRGQIKVKVVTASGRDITNLVTLVADGEQIESREGRYETGYYVFDALPTDNYDVLLQSLPEGTYLADDRDRKQVTFLNYADNVKELTFVVNGEPAVTIPTLEAVLQTKTIDVTKGDKAKVVYQINPESFEYPNEPDTLSFNPTLSFKLGQQLTLASTDVWINDEKVALTVTESEAGVLSVAAPTIQYTYNSSTSRYESEPFTLSFEVRADAIGEQLTFSSPNQMTYVDMFGRQLTQALNTPIFNVRADYEINIQVNDSAGDLNHTYHSFDALEQDQVMNEFSKSAYNLYGDAFANISFKGNTLNHLKYQIVKSDTTPNYPKAGWNDLVTGQTINDDIDFENQGNLTQKSYNVNHMPTLENMDAWKNPELVFKTSYDETKIKPTTCLATTPDEYVTEVNYTTNEGVQASRWETNCMFTTNQKIGNTYKEATKSWGYFKAFQTGWYEFKTFSDDGMRATLTIKTSKTPFIIIDEFEPRSAGNGVLSEGRVYLEEGEFYPLYIEYFNWGGSAAFSYMYRVSESETGAFSGDFKSLPGDALYPSKSKEPGESGNNSFTGNEGVKFPDEIGRYYVLYQAGESQLTAEGTVETPFSEPMVQGMYGPFNVEGRFDVARLFEGDQDYQVLEEVILNYQITPRPINVTDLYKTEEELNKPLKEQLTVTNLRLHDTLPSQFEFIDVLTSAYVPAINQTEEGLTTVEGPLETSVQYTLQKEDEANRKTYYYAADPFTVSIKLKVVEKGQAEFNAKSGVFIYNDVTLDVNTDGPHKESFIEKTDLVTQGRSYVAKQGFFTNDKARFIDEIETFNENIIPDEQVGRDVVLDATYYQATEFSIQSEYTVAQITIPKTVDDVKVQLPKAGGYFDTPALYPIVDDELDTSDENRILLQLTETSEVFTLSSEDAVLESGTNYVAVYPLQFSSVTNLQENIKPVRIQVTATVAFDRSRYVLDVLTTPVDKEESSDYYLPDLF